MGRKNSKAGEHRPRTAIPGKSFDPAREEKRLRRRCLPREKVKKRVPVR